MSAATWPTAPCRCRDDDLRSASGPRTDALGRHRRDGVGEAERELERRALRAGAVADARISSCARSPSVTPSTMLATSVRVSPCSARFCRVVGPLDDAASPSCCATVMSAGRRCWSSSPFGPFTVTVWPAMSTVDARGQGDRGSFRCGSLQVSTRRSRALRRRCRAARLAVGHEALAGGQDRDAQAAEHARDVGRLAA